MMKSAHRESIMVVTTLFAMIALMRVMAQTPSGLTGTWVLDTTAGGRGGGRGNFAGYATATRLVIKESPAEVVVQTNTGTEGKMVAAVYKLDGSENPVPGPLGWDTKASARWKEGTLVVTVKRSIQGPDGPLNFEIQDVYSLAGNVLTLERSQGSKVVKMVYNRASNG
ncbi:MAG: hypothetical protein ACRD1Q_13150 [Vicinamibacterales bacterium]